jgi:SAM-dependent methyltransferase
MLPPEILAYYDSGDEERRLEEGPGRLERARTEELILARLKPPPGRILDVGGGPGAYSVWLAKRGYAVRLLDPVPLHVEQAREALRPYPLADARLGNALELGEEAADTLLLLGPLYHLTDRADRLRALEEARRVLRPGGLLFAAAICRFASLFDGLFRGFLEDAPFASIVARDLREGQHRNPTARKDYFTTAFFHHPKELEEEVSEAGLVVREILGIEGPGWLLPHFEGAWADGAKRERILEAARVSGAEPTLVGLSAHLLAVASRD